MPSGAILLHELFVLLLEAGVIVVQDGVVTAVDAAWLYETPVSYTHLRAHETVLDLVCRLLLEKKKQLVPITYVYL